MKEQLLPVRVCFPEKISGSLTFEAIFKCFHSNEKQALHHAMVELVMVIALQDRVKVLGPQN